MDYEVMSAMPLVAVVRPKKAFDDDTRDHLVSLLQGHQQADMGRTIKEVR